jgi:hypothetical protein
MDLWISGQANIPNLIFTYFDPNFQETSSTVMAWGIAHMLHNSEARDKLYAELDRVIGDSNRMITMADRANLPYTNAVVNVMGKIELNRKYFDLGIPAYFEYDRAKLLQASAGRR